MKFGKKIFLIFTICFFAISSLQAAPGESCENAIPLSTAGTLSGQSIGSGEKLYYKIVVPAGGRLAVLTETDRNDPDNKVNTNGDFLDSNCATMSFREDVRSKSPRYFGFYNVLQPGTYYLKVENNSKLDDSNTNFRNGSFQIWTRFTETEANKIRLHKDVSKSPVEPGEEFDFKFRVYNYGEVEYKKGEIVITDSIDSRFELQANWNKSNAWHCTDDDNNITCTNNWTLKPHANIYLNIGVIAPDDVEEEISIKNTAFVDADNGAGVPVEDDDSINVSIGPIVKIKTDLSLDILDGMDEAAVSGIYFYTIVINKDGNDKVEDIILDINTTSEKDYNYIDYTSTDNWKCTKGKNSKILQCKLTPSFKADESQKKITIRVQAPSDETKVEITARVYSDSLDDPDLSNNSDSKTTTIKKTIEYVQNTREFTKVPFADDVVDMNIFGDILTIGNQSICEKDRRGNCKEPSYSVNDYINQKYVNLDTSGLATSYSTATSATLDDISPTDEIMWAGLYWMGRIDKSKVNWQALQAKASTVFIRHDSNKTSYLELNSLRDTANYDNNGNEIMVDKYNFINSTSYFNYQGVADVTKYIKENRGGKYWVADVTSSEGYNISSGWNLVVVVRDTKSTTRELKNITLYDGYKGVWQTPKGIKSDIYTPQVTQTVSGFLTPLTGNITSKLLFFAFEGDLTLPDFTAVDGTKLKNDLNDEKDVVNGTISKDGNYSTSRSPNLKNTSGIDIDEFNLGTTDNGPGIIGHSQTSAEISIGSLGLASNNGGGDQYFLGMFAFSTNLNDPVCYIQTFKNESYTSKLGEDGTYIDDIIGIEVEIKNKEIQRLEDVRSYIEIDSIFEEVNGTFELKNIGDVGYSSYTDFFKYAKVDRVDENLSEVTTTIGSGATSLNGGYLDGNKSIYIRFNAKIKDQNEDNSTKNKYSVSYKPESGKKIEISRCDGEDQRIHVLKNKPNGFEVTHKGGLKDGKTDGLMNGVKSNENHLFTQVVDQGFDIDIVALQDGDDKESLVRESSDRYNGLVELQAVAVDAINTCSNFEGIGAVSYVPFNNKIRVETNSTVFSVDKNASFRVRYLVDRYRNHLKWDSVGADLGSLQKMVQKANSDSICKKTCEDATDAQTCLDCVFEDVSKGGLSFSSCSTDKFAIRPEEINLSLGLGDQKPIGGRMYDLTLDSNEAGYDQNFSVSSSTSEAGYDSNFSASSSTGTKGGISLKSKKPLLCNSSDKVHTGNIAYINGRADVANFSYANVGEVLVTYTDKSWTDYEQNASSVNLSDCVVGSSDNTHNVNGKVGCEVSGFETFDFIPDGFTNTLVLEDGNGGFNYMANNSVNVAALSDISARLRLTVRASLAIGGVATNYSKDCFANEVNVAYDYNGTRPSVRFIRAVANTTDKFGFNVSRDDFTAGVSEVNTSVNFGRDSQVAENPFNVARNDFIVRVTDNVDATVTGTRVADADRNVSFYYGRLNIPDIETNLQNIFVNSQYEVYCNVNTGCDKTIFPFANGRESADGVFWYINNANHTALQGFFTNENSKNGMQLTNVTFGGMNVSLGAGNSAPHSDRITYTPSPWLVYDKFRAGAVNDSFNIKILSRGNWSGKGKIGKSVLGQDASEKTSKKMEW